MRFDNRSPHFNGEELYKEHFQKRGVNFIEQYETPNFHYPDVDAVQTLTVISHVWKLGDKYYKLAASYYNEPKLWWVIAWFNKKPTEQHVKLGETVLVPLFLDEVLTVIGL